MSLARSSLACAALAVVLGACATETPRDDSPRPAPAAAAAPVGSAGGAAHVAPCAVLIDRSAAAYTVFTRIPEGVPDDALESIRAQLVRGAPAECAPWSSFRERVRREHASRVLKDDYPDDDVPAGIADLLERYPGTPFGVTWNGGIAYTRNDYEHAKALHARWLADPSAPTRPGDGWDPILPAAHLGPLLGR